MCVMCFEENSFETVFFNYPLSCVEIFVKYESALEDFMGCFSGRTVNYFFFFLNIA